ncbi:MAG TPA: phosphoribosyltransferase family protein [Candidatus Binataceae bacterium]|nr:phosphoribosyltransferase family protein [Candidatus Binataceae bacterium]
MSSPEILELFAARKGHFRFESGHHGDLWLDIPRAYTNPRRLRNFASQLARRMIRHNAELVCGPLVEGALLAQMVAEEMGAEFVFAEQFVRTDPSRLFPTGYRIPAALRSFLTGKRVAVVDDVINAGSAVRGAIEDLETCGATVVAIGALMARIDQASALAASKGASLECLAPMPASQLWEPPQCPLCTSGIALE